MYNPIRENIPTVCRMKTSSRFPSKANENKFTYVAYSKAVLDDSLITVDSKSLDQHRLYTLFQYGYNFSILLFTCKLALLASLKGKFLLNFEFKNEATRAHLQANKRILKLAAILELGVFLWVIFVP